MQYPRCDGGGTTQQCRASRGAALLCPYKEIAAVLLCRASSAQLQAAIIKTRQIFYADGALFLMLAENIFKCRKHRREAGLIPGGHIGTAANAAGQALEVENLQIGNLPLPTGGGLEKSAHLFFTRITFVDARIVRAKFAKEGFEIAQERGRVRQAFVPENDDPPGGLPDTDEFTSRGVWFEPVEGLAGGNEVHAGIA